MNTQNIRVLEHDTADRIRIGYAFPSGDIVKTARAIVEAEDRKLLWAGGARLAVPKYYRRIALVNAATLETVMDIYDGKEWDPSLTL